MGSAGEMGAPRLRGSSSRVSRQRGAVRENRRSDQIPEPACWFIHFLKMFVCLFVCLFIYFERERERERESENPSRLHPVSAEPDVGLELTNHEIMT